MELAVSGSGALSDFRSTRSEGIGYGAELGKRGSCWRSTDAP
ncbi:hypothetical protein [Rhodococcus xishaensis]|nr:hypothetical protein [Rhodococcus xishaensis]